MNTTDNDVVGSDGKHYLVDVVCGMDIIEEKMCHTSEFRGITYYSCSRACQKYFDNFPERYIWEEL